MSDLEHKQAAIESQVRLGNLLWAVADGIDPVELRAAVLGKPIAVPEAPAVGVAPYWEAGVFCAASDSFEAINEFVHHEDVSFDDLKCACLGLAATLEKLRSGK